LYHNALRLRNKKRIARQELISNAIQNDVPGWVRRGHTRKPNGLVRFLYWIFDWLGDFGPMFRTLGRGIGATAKGTWGFLVRAVLITINILLMAGIIYVSVGHSYNMLVLAGMSGTAAIVFVGVWETVFIYCSILIDLDHYRGKKSGPAPWIGFLMGFAFVIVSNYMGMANNIIGKTIGISTPILLLVMKKVLQYQFQKKDKSIEKNKSWLSKLFDLIMLRKPDTQADVNTGAEVDADAETSLQSSTQTSVEMDAKVDVKTDTMTGTQMDAKTSIQLDAETGIKADVKTDAQVGVETGVKVGAQMDAKEDTDAGAKPDTEADTNVDVEVDIISGANTGAMADTKEGVEVGAKVDTQIDAQPDTQVDAIVDTKEDTDAGAESGAVDGANTDSQANTTTDTKPKQRRGKKNTAADDPDFKKVKRWARRFQKERGKLPGRVEIQKKFDGFGKSQCTKYAAMLKEELCEAS
jgi:hypothetical protein